MGFLENLRLSGIFEPGALAGQFPPMQPPRREVDRGITAQGMPDITQTLQQPNLTRIGQQAAGQESVQAPMNTVLGIEPMSDYQRAQIQLGKEGLGLERGRLEQSTRFDEARLALDRERGELAQLKNEQIYDIKLAEMQRRTEDSENRLKLAYDQLQARQGDAQTMMMFRQAQLDALNARHALETAQRDRQIQETARVNDARIQQIYDAMENAGYQISETELDPTGTRRTTVTRRGDEAKSTINAGQAPMPNQPPNTTPMMGGDGKIYYIPNASVNDSVSKYNMRFVDPTGKVK